MSEILLLPAPKPKKRQKWYLFPLFCTCFVIIVALLSNLFHQPEILASITFESFESQMKSRQNEMLEALIVSKNTQNLRVLVDGNHLLSAPLQDLGLNFSWNSQVKSSIKDGPVVSSFFEPLNTSLKGAAESPEDLALSADLTIDRSAWDAFLHDIKKKVEKDPTVPDILWSEEEGWFLKKAEKGIEITQTSIDRAFVELVTHLQGHHTAIELPLRTKSTVSRLQTHTRRRVNRLYHELKSITSSPVLIKIGDEEINFDLNADKAYIFINGEDLQINEKKIKEDMTKLAEEYFTPAGVVRITGREEVRPGVFKAVTEGEFKEGSRVNADELTQQVLDALRGGENEISVRLYEIPVKVHSDLENTDYELLSVGYSDYSTGNAANRVHNIQTGLSRINGTLIDPGQVISFNRFTGRIDNDFRTGWAIFGTVAKKSLGGGICQVSTTFYRSLLNLGVPITQRQNHSWDLSYYQKGGYGLDATIFPSAGLDVKGINDLDSQLFIYSYTRPESEEAFVLIYGKGDGRKVTLEPHDDYVPWRGAKTLKWTQKVEYLDGTIKENLIKSRYRS